MGKTQVVKLDVSAAFSVQDRKRSVRLVYLFLRVFLGIMQPQSPNDSVAAFKKKEFSHAPMLVSLMSACLQHWETCALSR